MSLVCASFVLLCYLVCGEMYHQLIITSIIQETQALLSMPGMRDAIHAGLAEPLAACARTLDG